MSSATDYLILNNQPLLNPATYSDEDDVRRIEREWGEAFELKTSQRSTSSWLTNTF